IRPGESVCRAKFHPARKSPSTSARSESDNSPGRESACSCRYRRHLQSLRTESLLKRMKKTDRRCKSQKVTGREASDGEELTATRLGLGLAEQQIDTVNQLGAGKRFGDI